MFGLLQVIAELISLKSSWTQAMLFRLKSTQLMTNFCTRICQIQQFYQASSKQKVCATIIHMYIFPFQRRTKHQLSKGK
ncbi:hypothetical protein CDL12_17120 [Handroanthus impetiginosus]|uniref:Uncharacterized protein n=1 Tax=Handroanthus impetiginosus TaxID=429701 RepID=A0A2G9GYE5_9LAMI|nr:hypothetical protein CDL12_17120 [Handroanthus impetiginosus]